MPDLNDNWHEILPKRSKNLPCAKQMHESGKKMTNGKNVKKINGFPAYAPDLALSNEGYSPESYGRLYELENKNFWFRTRNRLIISLIKKYNLIGKKYLEVGCGTGYVLSAVENEFPLMECWGSEIYVDGLKYTLERVKKAKLIQMDATRIPFKEKFDIVGAFDVIEHIEDDLRSLIQIHDAIKTGGFTIISVPQHPFMWSVTDVHAHHKRRYRRKDLVLKLEQAGFSVIAVKSFTSFLFPIMAINRFRIRNKDIKPGSEFNIPQWLNNLFEFILNIEIFLTLKNINLPFGGSLIIIGQKK